jgi:deoxyribodipyrimidine photo-lyase
MQASQRNEYNHALEYSIIKANELNRPVVIFFGLTAKYPNANQRHYKFMLEGLQELQHSLEERGLKIVIRKVSPEIGATQLAKNAALMVVDRGYLKIQKNWRIKVAKLIRCPLIQVESDVVVPVESASQKEEYSAATIRNKITNKLLNYVIPLKKRTPKKQSLELIFDSIEIENVSKLMRSLNIDKSVKTLDRFKGGTSEAKKNLHLFIKHKIDDYPKLRNDPTIDGLSNMSPYLHFGQISSLYVALKVLESNSQGKDAYLEELVVRRELSMNFVFYNDNYDNVQGLPTWAKKSLESHSADDRDHVYDLETFENAETHDPYWNAAQKEMVVGGKMHGYMRMYWGKKILEWTKNPEKAISVATYLNDKYELDGRDPNGYTGIAWCMGKHDRPWKERNIFGKIRYMNAQGLKRKFDADAYVKNIGNIAALC